MRDERDVGTRALAAMMCSLPQITEDGMSKEEGNLKTRGRVRRVRAVVTVCLVVREDSMAYVCRDPTARGRERGME